MPSFGAMNRNPKAFETQGPSSGALQLLMKALGQIGDGAVDIGNNAGTAIASEQLSEMTPEERGSKNISDKFGGLALTDEFRKKLAINENDAVTAEAQQKANEFTTSTNAIKNQYDIDGDARRNAYSVAAANRSAGSQMDRLKMRLAGQIGKSASAVGGFDRGKEQALTEYDNLIAKTSALATAQDTQDGRGTAEKTADVQQLKREKYNLLMQMGYKEPTARKMSLEDNALFKDFLKTIKAQTFVKKP